MLVNHRGVPCTIGQSRVNQCVWCVQAKLDTLDSGIRKVNAEWHDWGNVEEGGASKPSKVLA